MQRKLESLDELSGVFNGYNFFTTILCPPGQCDAAVNCSGLGARQLCGDTSVLPIRGQVSQPQQPKDFLSKTALLWLVDIASVCPLDQNCSLR